ncbi:MAG TPA: DUF2760 domain-containing protein [Oligoflexia bacterium]|nr:DUF2760 domain-containing protein [Oligoflexia bacterium]HMP49699.1 DUF2760 domain-containing protein [Oligoflexia bacterium]
MSFKLLLPRVIILVLACLSLWGFLNHIKGLPLSDKIATGMNSGPINISDMDANSLVLGVIFLASLTALGLSLLSREAPSKSAATNKTGSLTKSGLSPDAVMLLSLFQKEGRLIDFLNEDILTHDDNKVASACRIVHRGCSEVLKKYLEVEPIFDTAENSLIEKPDLPKSHIRISGSQSDKIRIIHKGWKLTGSRLPKSVSDDEEKSCLLYPAEAESVNS